MARRSDLLVEARTGQRRSGIGAFVLVLVVLGGAAFLAYKFIPKIEWGGNGGPGREGALGEARRLEAQSLDRTAAERYAGLLANRDIDAGTRYEAALGLARLGRGRLNDPVAAQSALEKAFLLAPDDDARTSVATQLAALRGYPVEQTTGSQGGGASAKAADRHAVARIGDETVTVDDLLFAWSQSYGAQPPDAAEFEPFVQRYLDMALLADEARRRGLETKGRTALELKFNRLLTLTKNLSALMMEKLPQPTEEQLRQFYEANKEAWSAGPRGRIGAFGVKDESRTKAVRDAFAEGDDFEEIAGRYGGATASKATGEGIGEIDAQTQTFELVGTVPGLAPFLLSLNDGETTGPLRAADGFYWFKMLKKLPPAPPPHYEQVRDDALVRYQTLQLAQAREALLNDLRANRRIVLNEEALRTSPHIQTGEALTSPAQNATPPANQQGQANFENSNLDSP